MKILQICIENINFILFWIYFAGFIYNSAVLLITKQARLGLFVAQQGHFIGGKVLCFYNIIVLLLAPITHVIIQYTFYQSMGYVLLLRLMF